MGTDDKNNGYAQNQTVVATDIAQLQARIAQLEAENNRLKQYFSFSSRVSATSAASNVASIEKGKEKTGEAGTPDKNLEELERQNYRFHQILTNANAGIVIQTGPEHIFQFANPAYQAVVERSPERLLGLSIRQAFPDLEGQGLYEAMDEVVRTGQPFVAKERLVRLVLKENEAPTEVFGTFTYHPLFTIEGEIEGFFTHAVVVTEEVRARQKIEELNRFRDEFLAIASHDLRTPITSVKGFIQLLERNFIKHQKAQLDTAEGDSSLQEESDFVDTNLHLIGRVLSQINRLTELISRLLDFSQLAEGRLTLQYSEQVDLVALVQEVVGGISQSHEEHSIVIEPPADQGVVISCDAIRLEEVLNNLLSNALKYSPPRTVVTIGLQTSSHEEEVVLWVKDQGYGIEPAQQPRLFERFYRVQNELNATKGGFGLGLYITAEIVKQHKGRLWLDSAVGKGSTFYMALPCQRPN